MTKPRVKRALTKVKGNIAALGRRFGMTRQAASQWVAKYDLASEAVKLRAQHGMPGSRPNLEGGSVRPDRDRIRIQRALKRHKSISAAARAIGMKRDRLRRMMSNLSITWPVEPAAPSTT